MTSTEWYQEFAELVHPIYVANNWKWYAFDPEEPRIPTVEDIASTACWAHGQCLISERKNTYATTGRVRCEKSTDDQGNVTYKLLIDVLSRYS